MKDLNLQINDFDKVIKDNIRSKWAIQFAILFVFLLMMNCI